VAGLRRCFQPAGGWFTAKRTALRVWTTSNRTGPIYVRRVCARGWQRAGRAIGKPCGWGYVDGRKRRTCKDFQGERRRKCAEFGVLAREQYVLVPFAVTGRVNALETSPTTRLLLGAQSFHRQQALEPWSKTARFAKSGRNTDNRRSCCGKYGHGPGRPLWPSKPPWLEASAASGS
jgi:hypothetical protein